MWPLLLIFPLQSWAWGWTTETPISPYFPLAEYIKPVNNYGVQATLSTAVYWQPGACLIQDRERAYLFILHWTTESYRLISCLCFDPNGKSKSKILIFVCAQFSSWKSNVCTSWAHIVWRFPLCIITLCLHTNMAWQWRISCKVNIRQITAF